VDLQVQEQKVVLVQTEKQPPPQTQLARHWVRVQDVHWTGGWVVAGGADGSCSEARKSAVESAGACVAAGEGEDCCAWRERPTAETPIRNRARTQNRFMTVPPEFRAGARAGPVNDLLG
jgi:hypothetical protein